MKKLISLLIVMVIVSMVHATEYMSPFSITTDYFDGAYGVSDGNNLDDGSIATNKLNSTAYLWVSGKADSAAMTTALAGKMAVPTGNSLQYLNGAGTPTTFPSIPSVFPILVTNLITHTIVTSSNSANGFSLSATRPMFVTYSVTITSSSTLSGGSAGYVVLEICSSNSSTGTDWMECSRITNGQTNTLIIGLALTQPCGGNMTAMVPNGYFLRLRSVNTTGTPSYVYNSGEEVSM